MVFCDVLEGWDVWGGGEVGGDICIRMLIYFVVQQKTTQHGRAIILQLKLKGPQATGNPIFTFNKMTSSHSKLKQKPLIPLLARLPAFMR